MIKSLFIVFVILCAAKINGQSLMSVPLTASSSGQQPFSLSEIIIFNHSGLLVSIVSNDKVNIEEYSKSNEHYFVYPNPAGNSLNIFSTELNSENKIELLDSRGSMIRVDVIGKELNISDLIPGIYFININSKVCLKFKKI
ncbi:MAG: T9SS type A sorting domain-containing protein [Saprospiraceae bacterium]